MADLETELPRGDHWQGARYDSGPAPMAERSLHGLRRRLAELLR